MSGPYVISAESYIPDADPISHRRDTAVEAFSKAVELMGQGMKNVLIIDAQKNVYTSADFAQLVAGKEK
jgi:hypothetical protein